MPSAEEARRDFYKRAPREFAPHAIRILEQLRVQLEHERNFVVACNGADADALRRSRDAMDAGFAELVRAVGGLADAPPGHAYWIAHMAKWVGTRFDYYATAREMSKVDGTGVKLALTFASGADATISEFLRDWQRVERGLPPPETNGTHGMEVM